MQPPTACPRCSSPRTWLEPAPCDTFTGRRRVRCIVCRREAAACVRCGWEFVTAGPRTGECACAGVEVTGRPGDRWPSLGLRRRSAAAAADADEEHALLRYRAGRVLASVVAEAASRAAAAARLDAALRSSSNL